MMKKIIFPIIILILIALIGYTQFRIGGINNSKDKRVGQKGQVKSAHTDILSNRTNALDITKIKLYPKQVTNSSDPKIYADSYILLDTQTFYKLAEKNSDLPVPIASTTKIMTALITLENYSLDEVVTISQNAATQIGSDVNLKSNEKLTVKNLLYALLIQSGNDAAMALAEHYSGGVAGFVQLMNSKANYLGLKNTNYKDPAGLDDSAHSTAKDLAILTSYTLQNENFRNIVQTQQYTISSVDGGITHQLISSNRLIKNDSPLFYPSAIGVKTGFTPDAGHCLVSAVEKNKHLLVSVVLHTNEDSPEASARESRKLIDWGINNFVWND